MKIKFVVVCMIAVLAIPIIANAVTMTQTDSFTGSVLDFARVSTFNKFDSSWGTLTSVTVSVGLQIDSGSFIADNDSDQPASVTFTYQVNGALTSGDVFISPGVNLSISDNVGLTLGVENGDGVGVIDGTGPDGTYITPSSSLYTTAQVMANPVFFVGSGTFDTLFSSARLFNIAGGSGIEGGYTNMTGTGSVEVVYEYVPEPATLALLGLGSLVLRKKRK